MLLFVVAAVLTKKDSDNAAAMIFEIFIFPPEKFDTIIV